MQYTLKIAAISGDICVLIAVAHAMALRDATAKDTPYHAPTFEGRHKGYILTLLKEVRSGRLEVCDSFGTPIPINPRIKTTNDFAYIWSAKLKKLNEWAEKRGDSFVISYEGVGWIDERGHVVPTSQDVQDPKVASGLALDRWKDSARKIRDEIAKQHKNLNRDQIAKKVHEAMLKRNADGDLGMTGRGGRVPSSETIKRHALQRKRTF